MKHFWYTITLSIVFLGLLNWTAFAAQTKIPPSAEAPASTDAEKKKPKSPYVTALEGTKLIGDGLVTAYKKDDSFLIELPKNLIGRLFLWYSEAVSLPTEAVSSGLEAVADTEGRTTVVTFERHGSRILIRNHTPGYAKRVGADDPVSPYHYKRKINPIQVSVDDSSNGPIIAVLPVLGESPDGNILVDISKVFANDIESLTARSHVLSTGLMPVSVDPTRSYIADVNCLRTILIFDPI